MINIGITTILKAENTIIQQAKKQAQVMGYPYVEREGKLVELAEKTKMTGFLIYGKTLPLFWTPQGVYQFHLGTAVLRIEQIKKGNGDRLCYLLPKECHSVLDCTFGHGGDSLNIRQMKELIADLFHTTRPFVCPHGRPTIVKFTAVELGRLFKR